MQLLTKINKLERAEEIKLIIAEIIKNFDKMPEFYYDEVIKAVTRKGLSLGLSVLEMNNMTLEYLS